MALVCFFGGANDAMPRACMDDARELARLLAMQGNNMVFGGGEGGVMGAAVRGASQGGARVTGVVPEYLNLPGVIYQRCDELVITSGMRDRAERMMDAADAYVVLPGGIGTLYEMLEVLVLRQLGRHRKPIVLLNTNGFYDTLLGFLTELIDVGACTLDCATLYQTAQSPQEAARLVTEGLAQP